VLAKINFQNKEGPGLHLGKDQTRTDGDAAADEKKPLGFEVLESATIALAELPEVGRCRLTLRNPH